jgi:DNA polymerase-3 subunit delta
VKLAAAAARKFLNSPDPSIRAVLLYGPNRALIREGAETLAQRALGKTPDPFALTRLAEEDLRRDKARLSDALAAQSLLGGASVVWLRIEGETVSEAILSGLKELEKNASACAYWIVEAGDIGGKSRIVAAFENAGQAAAIALYEETDAERTIALKAAISAARLNMTPDAVEHFTATAPTDRTLARGEIEKLILYSHDLGRPLEIEDLEALAASEDESQLDRAAIAAASGQGAQAVEFLETHASGGIPAIKALERRLLRLLEARKFVDEGVPIADAGDRLKPKVFWKERDIFAGHVRRWSALRLRMALNALWAAELRCKTAGAPQDVLAAQAYRQVSMLAAAAD